MSQTLGISTVVQQSGFGVPVARSNEQSILVLDPVVLLMGVPDGPPDACCDRKKHDEDNGDLSPQRHVSPLVPRTVRCLNPRVPCRYQLHLALSRKIVAKCDPE